MLEVKGNIWQFHKKDPLSAIVITTNGYVGGASGRNTMGRGIAKEAAIRFPEFPLVLGSKITEAGNHVHWITHWLPGYRFLTFPVKPTVGHYDGNNVVAHMRNRFKVGDAVPGWAMKADIGLIIQSLMELRGQTEGFNNNIYCPKFGCGWGELKWENVKPLCAGLDDRFIICDFN